MGAMRAAALRQRSFRLLRSHMANINSLAHLRTFRLVVEWKRLIRAFPLDFAPKESVCGRGGQTIDL
jgi:hypothetical protein